MASAGAGSHLPPLHTASPAPSPQHQQSQQQLQQQQQQQQQQLLQNSSYSLQSSPTHLHNSSAHMSPASASGSFGPSGSSFPAGAHAAAAAYLQSSLEDREVISSNVNDRTRLLLDILQLVPPPVAPPLTHTHSAPGVNPSPKPLFGTRPPPAAIAMQRGFSVGSRDRAERERAERERAESMGSGLDGLSASASPMRPLSPAVGASFDSPYGHRPSPSFGSGFVSRREREGPLCSGWLSIQKNAGKWKRYWCEYGADGVLSYRTDDTTKKPAGTIQVAYCEAEITQLPLNQLSSKRRGPEDAVDAAADGMARLTMDRSSSGPPLLPAIHSPSSTGNPSFAAAMSPGPSASAGTSAGTGASASAAAASSTAAASGAGPAPSSSSVASHLLAPPALPGPMCKYTEAYWRYLEDEGAFWAFKVVSATRVFLFKADNPGTPAALQAAASASSPAGSVCGEELRNLFVTTIRAHLQQLFAGPAPVPAPVPAATVSSLPALNFGTAPAHGSAATGSAGAGAGANAGSNGSGPDSPQRVPSPPVPSTTPPPASTSSLLWKLKNECMGEMTPLLHEQFLIQIGRFKALQAALAKSGSGAGFVEDELPITSVRKEKSGVLCMEKAPGSVDGKDSKGGMASAAASSSSSAASSSSALASSSSSSALGDDATKWRDYYFVLFEGALFYYADSKSTTPTGFITLRFASLVVDPRRLSKQEYVFHVVTPLRTICCKTKHAVALSEWISVLEHTLGQYAKKNLAQWGTATAGGTGGAGNAAALYPSSFGGGMWPFNKDGTIVPAQGLGGLGGGGLGGAGGAGGSTPQGHAGKSHFASGTLTVGGSGNGGMLGAAGGNPSTPQRPHGKSGSMDQSPGGSGGSGGGGGSAGAAGGSDRKSSLAVLQNINKWINLELLSSTLNFQSIVQQPQGLEHFRKFLRDDENPNASPRAGASGAGTAHAHLDFYLATQEYMNLFTSSTPPMPSDVSLLATQIFARFLTPLNAAEFLAETTEDQRGVIEDQLPSPAPNTFDAVRAVSTAILNNEFAEFKRTPEFNALNDILNKNVVEDKRDIDQFELTSSQLFMIKVKGNKKSREVPLLKKKSVHTIGRDKSNMLVIEDSRVSRSHARVEYSDTQCEYIDLGSSCGSKLNGKPVLRAKLRPGDVIELGQSVLIFQVRKKKTMAENLIAMIKG